jgi:hypothetical protein
MRISQWQLHSLSLSNGERFPLPNRGGAAHRFNQFKVGRLCNTLIFRQTNLFIKNDCSVGCAAGVMQHLLNLPEISQERTYQSAGIFQDLGSAGLVTDADILTLLILRWHCGHSKIKAYPTLSLNGLFH